MRTLDIGDEVIVIDEHSTEHLATVTGVHDNPDRTVYDFVLDKNSLFTVSNVCHKSLVIPKGPYWKEKPIAPVADILVVPLVSMEDKLVKDNAIK